LSITQAYFDGIRVALIKHLLDLQRPILPGAALSYPDMTSAGQRLYFHENFGDPTSDILIIYPFGLSRFAGDRLNNLANQLFTGLVHAHHRKSGGVWKMINLKHILHCRYERGVPFWGDFPVFAEVRFKFSFF
jgi:hypothetical protein